MLFKTSYRAACRQSFGQVDIGHERAPVARDAISFVCPPSPHRSLHGMHGWHLWVFPRAPSSPRAERCAPTIAGLSLSTDCATEHRRVASASLRASSLDRWERRRRRDISRLQLTDSLADWPLTGD